MSYLTSFLRNYLHNSLDLVIILSYIMFSIDFWNIIITKGFDLHFLTLSKVSPHQIVMHQTLYQSLLLHYIKFPDIALYCSGVWNQQIVETKWSVYNQTLEMFHEKRSSQDFTEYKEKHLCWSYFLNKSLKKRLRLPVSFVNMF